MIKGSTQQEDMTFENIYAFNRGAPRYIKQILVNIKGGIDSNTIIVGDFNTTLTSMNRSPRQKINKETLTLNDTLDQMNLRDIHKTSHPKTAEHTFFSSAYETFSRTDHMLRHNTSLNKFNKTEIIIKHLFQLQQYETRNQLQKENWKKHKHVETKQHATKQSANEEIKEEIKIYRTNESGNTTFPNLWNVTLQK